MELGRYAPGQLQEAQGAWYAATAHEVQTLDRLAAERYGIPTLLLMDSAGFAVAREAERVVAGRPGCILICCGTGQNGGDGFAAARHLAQRGHRVEVWHVATSQPMREIPAIHYRMLRGWQVSCREVSDVRPAEVRLLGGSPSLIVDALLGTGLQGLVRPPYDGLIHAMNASASPVLAVDIPSGLATDTGEVLGCAVEADVTVTFGWPKRGFFLADGPRHVGTLVLDDLMFPPTLLRQRGP